MGPVFALDLGVRSGFAVGRPGERPRAGAVLLKKAGEHRAVAFAALLTFLEQEFTAAKPELLVKEAWWGLGASGERGNSEAVVYMHVGLHGVVEAVCGRYGVPWRECTAGQARKHFIGKAYAGAPRQRGVKLSRQQKDEQREATKNAVKVRCRLLKILPPEFDDDDNVADALAVHDWGCFTYGRRSVSSQELHLFGQEPQT